MSKVSVKQAPHIDHTNAYTVTEDNYGVVKEWIVWTGTDGKGLWLNGKQVEGRAQFDAGNNASAAIRRYFQKGL